MLCEKFQQNSSPRQIRLQAQFQQPSCPYHKVTHSLYSDDMQSGIHLVSDAGMKKKFAAFTLPDSAGCGNIFQRNLFFVVLLYEPNHIF